MIGPDEPDLVGTLITPQEIDCDNSADDDGDGLVDCEDPDCQEAENCKADTFRRGDCNDDGAVNITDGVCILNWLFLGEATPGFRMVP